MKIVIAVVTILIVLILVEIKRELSAFKTVQYEIKVDGLKREKKIVFLSDLHNHEYGSENDELIEAIRKESPDIILIGGDMLVGKEKKKFDVALEFVKKLPAIAPVYYANGNHEQRMKEFPGNYTASYKEYKDELVLSGVSFLENNSIRFNWDGKTVKVTGLEIPLRCYTHFRKGTMDTMEIIERIGMKEDNIYEIVMAHNPSYMKRYLERGADLILSGHLHGGIARLPGIVGAISPSFEIFPKYSGDLYHENDTDIVVSKGLGTHTINLRFLNPAEVVVIKLKNQI